MNIPKPIANSINILLVDDNPDNLRLLSNILIEKGYQTRRVISGEMALKASKATNFGLILLDINMPNLDGYEVCRQLKADSQTAKIPVIFISAYNEILDKVKAFNVGGADYISKPFQLEEVLARVDNQVKISNLQQQLEKLNNNLEQQINERTKELQIANKKLKEYQQKLLNRSLKDTVTNLDNKISFLSQLRHTSKLLKIKPNYNFSMFVFECYCPQLTSKAFDLRIEDLISLNIAERLSNSVDSCRVMARLGEHEFVIIIDGVSALESATEIAEKIKAKLTLPLDFNGQKFEIEVQYGIAFGIKDSDNPEQILKNARTLARQAKAQNYYTLQTLEKKIDLNESNNFNIVTEFELAFKKQELTLLYQPIISLNNHEIKELEVFLSWGKGEKQIISSSEIAQVIQQNLSLNIAVLNWIFKTANSDFKKWQELIIWEVNSSQKNENIMIRLKLLETELLQPDLIQYLKNITNNLEIDRKNIILEISEAFVQKNTLLAVKIIPQLKKLGFYLSIDNLSSRYLTLNNQYQLNIDNLKIANCLTNKIDTSTSQRTIITQIIGLAHHLNMTVIATDIETSEQLKSWQELGCELGTGNFFSQPVSSQEIENLMLNFSWLM